MKSFSGILLAVILFPCSYAAIAQAESDLYRLMSRWIDLETQKGRAQSEWNNRKLELNQRLELYQIEQETLQNVLAQTDLSTSEVDERRLALLEMQEKLESEQVLMQSQLEEAMTMALALHPRLPPPLHEQWQDMFPQLSHEGSSGKLEDILGLFKLVEEFNQRIAMHRTIMKIPSPDGQSLVLLVTQVYLGAGQGWYVSDDGSHYGYGRAAVDGWRWWHMDEATAQLGRDLNPEDLLKTVGMLENPTTAGFVKLPVTIK